MFLQAQITINNRKLAYNVAQAIVDNKLAACVQILGPIQSIYRWKGNVEQEEEFLCLIKTTDDEYDEMEKMILEMHPYEVPEIVASPIVRGNSKYLNWLLASTEGED